MEEFQFEDACKRCIFDFFDRIEEFSKNKKRLGPRERKKERKFLKVN